MSLPILVAAAFEPAPHASAVSNLPPCAARDLTFDVGPAPPASSGGPGSGASMVVRNTGASACRVSALPRVTFEGIDGHTLPIRFRPPVGFHPGPVVLPVGIVPGARITAALRWDPADMTGGRCYTTGSMTVAFGAATLSAPIHAQLCGPPDGPAVFGQEWFRTDARLQP